MNILLIEDEQSVADFIKRGLMAEGWTVSHAIDGETGIKMVADDDYDLILLDLMLPGISGQDTCRKIRARDITTPVIMLTALDANEEVIKGLQVGADDYITKPFDFDVLVARVEALYRRSKDRNYNGIEKGMLTMGDLSFNLDSLQVTCAGEILELTPKEREIIKLFLSNPNKTLSRERILNTIWSSNEDPHTNVVDVYIAKLRQKLGSSSNAIKTVRGVGYILQK